MKNILILLFLLPLTLLGQTKEEAFAEMNAIVKKLEGKTIATMDDGNSIILAKQTVYPEFSFEVKSADVNIITGGKDIKWQSYKRTSVKKDKSGYVIYTIKFREKFQVFMDTGFEKHTGPYDEVAVYIEKTDVARFEELVKIVTSKE